MRAVIALSREGLACVRVRPHRGRHAALARWQGRVSAVSHTRPNHNALELLFCDLSAAWPRFVPRLARSDSPQSRGPCPPADPPSPRPSRSASQVARSRLRGLPHAPYVSARTPVPIYCYLLLLLGLLPCLLPSNRLIILYSYLYTYHVLLVLRSNNYSGVYCYWYDSGLYITKTRCLRIYWPQYVHTCLLYTSPSPRDKRQSRMPSSA